MGDSKIRTIFSGISWTVIQSAISILYSIVSVPFLIGYFGKEQYGLISLALSVNVYLQLVDIGMTNSNVRFLSHFIEKGETDNVQSLFGLTHYIYLLVGIANTIILFVVALFCDSIFNVSPGQTITLKNLLFILCLNSSFSWVSVCYDQLLRSYELIDWIKKRSAFLKLLQFVILAIVVLGKLSIEIYFFGCTFLLTLILPWTVIKVKRISPTLSLRPRFDLAMLKLILPYTLSVFSISIFQFLSSGARSLFLGSMDGAGSVAEFSVINTIASLVTIFSSTFTQVLLPIVSKFSANKQTDSISLIINKGSEYANIFISLIVFLLILSSKELISLYVGESFIPINKWLIVFLLMLLLSHRNVMTSLVFTETHLKSVAIMGSIAMIVAVACYYFLIPLCGLGGVIIGYLLHEIIHTAFYYFYFFPKRFEINTIALFLKRILPIWLICTLVVLLVGTIFNQIIVHPLVSMLLKSAIFAIVYFTSVWMCFFNKNDRDMILQIKEILWTKKQK